MAIVTPFLLELKMKIRLLTALSGAKESYSYGDPYECDKDQAERMIKKGLAEPLQKTTKKKAKK